MMLSIVIPCFNHGQFIQEAIDSVITYQDQPIEIIIVDDGSTAPRTLDKIKELKDNGFHIIQQENSGLAKARNAGIAAANGKYILPLDADNKINSDYIKKAIILLETNYCDIVYAKPSFFGEVSENRLFKPYNFVGTDLIFGNYIDACAIYKKEVWIKNKGYDFSMPFQGVEDWDFWLNSYFNNFKFHFIDEELYYYRVLKNSMISETRLLDAGNRETINYFMNKYGYRIIEDLQKSYSFSKMYTRDLEHPVRSIFKYVYRAFKPLKR